MLALAILAIVFILIAVRQIGNFRMQIWQIMLGGALAVLLARQIGISEALRAINPDVLIFLACMFLIGAALEESGYLGQLSFRLFRHARSTDMLVLSVLLCFGLLSAFLMNDTLAVVGVPVVLAFSQRHRMSAKLLLLALCFAVTIGSVMSPIGNPQNLLIAFELPNPFVSFARYLFLPTVISLGVAYLLLRLFYRREFHDRPLQHNLPAITDERLASLAKLSLLLLILGITLKIALVYAGTDFRMTYIAVAAALPIMFARDKRVLLRIDWRTLVFFAAMFVLMEAVWATGVLQWLAPDLRIGSILLSGVLVSQLISNVPFVALFLPMVAGTRELIALAAGSTIAGNLLILGAASNVIIIQQAEARGETLTFWEFAKVGIPLTAVCLAVYWLFI